MFLQKNPFFISIYEDKLINQNLKTYFIDKKKRKKKLTYIQVDFSPKINFIFINLIDEK